MHPLSLSAILDNIKCIFTKRPYFQISFVRAQYVANSSASRNQIVRRKGDALSVIVAHDFVFAIRRLGYYNIGRSEFLFLLKITRPTLRCKD